MGNPLLERSSPILIWILGLFLFGTIADRTHGQDEFFTPAPEQYRIYGSAKDDQGQPIPEATASLVTLPTEPFNTLQYLLETPAVSSVECQNDGSFDIKIPGDDKRWNVVNERTNHLLIVEAPGYEISVTKFQRERMLVKFPIHVTANKCEGCKLKIVDQEGSAVSNLEVRPAVVSGNMLPHKLDVLKPTVNLGEGFYQFEELTEKSLDGVYVSSDAGFNFRLPTESKDGIVTVQLPETGSVDGSFEVSDGVDNSELVGKKVVVAAGNLFQRNETNVEPLSWSIKTLDESTKVSFDHVVFGFTQFGLVDPNSIKLSNSLKDLAMPKTLSAENSPLEIVQKLYPSRVLKLRFTDESGETISTITTSGLGSLSGDIADGNSESDGAIAMRIAVDDKPSGQLFPFDSTGQYQVTSPFGVMLDRLKMVNGEPKPIEMTRSRSIRGRVTDAQGEIVAGAKVEYTIQSERFTRTKSVLSSESGTFEIGGLPANTNVALKAGKGNQATPEEANIFVMSGHMEEVSIPVVEQVVAAVRGTILDQGGAPVSGANVKLYVANVSQAEGYSAESLIAAEMIPGFEGVVSDDNGKFEYPATTQFKQRIQVVVSADGYRDLRYPFIDGQLKDISEDAIGLGEFSLFKLPTAKDAAVTVTDESGNPVKDAKIVFVGIDTEKQIVTSDEKGKATVKLDDTTQLVAAKADGYQLNLSVLDQVPETIELSLAAEIDQAETLAWIEKDWKPFHEQSQILLEKLQVPLPKESTFYRQNRFFKSQLNTDFAAFQKVFSESDAYEHKENILMFNASECFLHDPEASVSLLQSSSMPPQQKAMLLANFALLAEDEDLKEELYGEAILMTGESSGVNQTMTIGSLAGCLVVDGKIDAAKELVAEAWNEAKELREQLEAGEAKTNIGQSRAFAPVLALVDPNAAVDLVQLSASEVEMPGLVSQCLAYASLSGDHDMDAICKEKGVKFNASGLSQSRALMAIDLSHVRYEMLSAWVQKHVDVMPESTSKIASIMLAARHMPAGPDRAKLIEMAASARKACNPSYYYDDPAKEILEELPKFDSLTTAEFDELLFATIEHAPTKINSFQLNGVFASLVKMLAIREPKLARKILDPAFENGAWRYGDPQWSAFENNWLLQAYAWIDPEIASQKAVELSEVYSQDDPVRELQLLTLVIDELNSIAIRKGMLRSR